MTNLTTEQIDRLHARWCARSVLHLWEAPEVVVEWLDTGKEALRDASRDASRAASRAASMAASMAARAAARAAGWAAAGDSARAAAGDSARTAGWAAAGDAWSIRAAGWAAASAAASAAQEKAKDVIRALAEALNSLQDLRLDLAWVDPWLTREVWRSKGLPDLELVESWYQQRRKLKWARGEE